MIVPFDVAKLGQDQAYSVVVGVAQYSRRFVCGGLTANSMIVAVDQHPSSSHPKSMFIVVGVFTDMAQYPSKL